MSSKVVNHVSISRGRNNRKGLRLYTHEELRSRSFVKHEAAHVLCLYLNSNNNNTLFNEGNIIYWLPSSLQYGPP